jgi:hypothetical protein
MNNLQCAGTNCPRRDECRHYARTYFETPKPFLSTLCEWVNGEHLDYFEPVDVVKADEVVLEVVRLC